MRAIVCVVVNIQEQSRQGTGLTFGVYGPVVAPPYLAPAPAYAPTTYGAPLQAYGAAPGLVMQRRVYVDEAPRPPAVPPYGRTRR
jgi:hypothetical protein